MMRGANSITVTSMPSSAAEAADFEPDQARADHDQMLAAGRARS